MNRESHEEQVRRITAKAAGTFSGFGRGTPKQELNPLSAAFDKRPPMFALGVDMGLVVRFVLEQAAVPHLLAACEQWELIDEVASNLADADMGPEWDATLEKLTVMATNMRSAVAKAKGGAA